MVGQPAQQHKSTNNTTQHIYTTTYKNYPGFTVDSHLFSKIVPNFFTTKYLNTLQTLQKSTKHNAFSTIKTAILVVTVHFQRITFHSSILKCKPNDLFTTSNKPTDDLVCANADATTGIS